MPGPGFTGSEQVYNMFNTNPGSSFFSNSYHTDYCLDTGYFQDTTLVDIRNRRSREYSTFTTQMLKDKLALYKVMTCMRWKEITQWENLQDSPRLTLSGDTGYGIHAIYSGDSSHLLIWLLNELRPLPKDNYTVTNHAPSLVISGFPYGSYKVSWYNPETGELIGSPGTFTGTSISLTCPSFSRDIAAIIQGEE